MLTPTNWLQCKHNSLPTSFLVRILGTLMMIFYISVCSSLLTPFRCHLHPSKISTIQSYHEVLCNGSGEHLGMALIGGLMFLMPLSFIAFSWWTVAFRLPKKILEADMAFLRSCSFLIFRFRPGAEVFSVLFLTKNMLLSLLPLIPSASSRVLLMNLLLSCKVALTALSKPWKMKVINLLEVFLGVSLIIIVTLGTLFIEEVDEGPAIVTCMVLLICMFAMIFGSMVYGVVKYLLERSRKRFQFFLCHHKGAAGSVARLMKMELTKRRLSAFVDCDDLADLTQLFWYVGQETSTFVILGTSEVLQRKWCMGEMVTARTQGVRTVLLTWPNFLHPTEQFILDYATLVPDIQDLAKFQIGMADVVDTLRWINGVDALAMSPLVTCETMASLADALCESRSGAGTQSSSLAVSKRTTQATPKAADCVIIADCGNMEAAATAHILFNMLLKLLRLSSRCSVPRVLLEGDNVPDDAEAALMICSTGCFRSSCVAELLLEATKKPYRCA